MTYWDEMETSGRLRPQVHIGSFTTYRLGGAASWLMEPENEERSHPDRLGGVWPRP